MRELLYILIVPMTSLVGLAAFTAWWSAAAFITGLALVAVYAVRKHDRHHRSEVYDDRLTNERVDRARKWLLEE